MSRTKFIVTVAGSELTYIGRTVDGTYYIEALIVRVGPNKDVYKFKVHDVTADTNFLIAGRPPRKVVDCDFSLVKTDSQADSAIMHTADVPPKVVALNSTWYQQLAA